MVKLRLAILESPNPMDLFDGRSEATALVASCRLMGHQVASFFVRSKREFKETVAYLASSDSIHADRNPTSPFILHISVHGNENDVSFGLDRVSWKDLVVTLEPLLKNIDYLGRIVLSISSCGSSENDLSKYIVNSHVDSSQTKMPKYIFAINDETVSWDDALIAWNMLYHKLSRFQICQSDKVQRAIKEIRIGSSVKISYHRWDDENRKYMRSQRNT